MRLQITARGVHSNGNGLNCIVQFFWNIICKEGSREKDSSEICRMPVQTILLYDRFSYFDCSHSCVSQVLLCWEVVVVMGVTVIWW